MMGYQYWYDLREQLSDNEKVDYLRTVFCREAPFDPLHNLMDAWSLIESKGFTKVEFEREDDATRLYNCRAYIGSNTCFDDWYAATLQEAIVNVVMKAYDSGVRIW